MDKQPLDSMLRIRMTIEDHKKLEQIRKAYRLDTWSQTVRCMIRLTADRLKRDANEQKPAGEADNA